MTVLGPSLKKERTQKQNSKETGLQKREGDEIPSTKRGGEEKKREGEFGRKRVTRKRKGV